MDSCCASQQICCLPGLLAAWLYMRTITRDCMTDDSSRAQMIDRESAPGRLEPAAVSLSRSSAHGYGAGLVAAMAMGGPGRRS
jgi:hypothetical protein